MKEKIKDFIIINFGLLLTSVGVYFFKIPNGFATGGVSGFATVIAKLSGSSTPATLIAIINAALMVVGFLVLGKGFGLKTAYCTVVYSGETWLFEHFIPLDGPLTDQPFMELFMAMLLTAIGSAILFSRSASSGGTDVVAMILTKYTKINVGTALLISDCAVAVSSFFAFDLKTGLFSLLGLFAKAFLVDSVIENMNLCKSFMIITNKPEEIETYIMSGLHRGATLLNGSGAFTSDGKTVILTVCHRYEAAKIRAKAKSIDPHAFIIITNSSEIIGKGFMSV